MKLSEIRLQPGADVRLQGGQGAQRENRVGFKSSANLALHLIGDCVALVEEGQTPEGKPYPVRLVPVRALEWALVSREEFDKAMAPAVRVSK